MKILSLHCDYIKFKPTKKAMKSVNDLEEDQKEEKEVKEPLVIFAAVEDRDKNEKQLVENVKDLVKKVNAEKIVLYPYAHLSSNLSSPHKATEILNKAKEELAKNYEVVNAPFGYYKQFELKCKGHPLSELSREFGPEKGKTEREKISEQIDRNYYILTPGGEEYEVNIEDEKTVKKALKKIGDKQFETYILNNEVKEGKQKEPPSIKEMQRQELVGYCPEADSGHFKFYPKGNLIFELLKEWDEEIAVNRLNALQIDTPIIYDWDDKEIREQGGSFHERHYLVKSKADPKKKWVMRFAGDFGLFKIMKNANLSYKNLPLRMYEFSKSFRYEQKGELSGLKRLRAFHMPDIHSFTENIDKGWKEYKELYKKYDDLAKGTGIKYAIVFRVVEDFYEENKEQIIEMLKYSDMPAFIETLSEMKHYWAVKHEFNGLDSVNGATQLSTVQLDVKDAETYGITYKTKNNEDKGCTIVHSSVGSVERWLYCILEKALAEDKPSWPFWLSPTQVRITPVSDDFIEGCKKLAKKLNKNKIRADVDDRSLSMGKKVSESEKEWVPYTITIGEEEKESGKLALRTRRTGKVSKIKEDKLIKKLKKQQEDMPWKPLPLPTLLSKRPIFVG